MPRLTFGKYLENRSKRKQIKDNQKSAKENVKVINDYFTDNEYPYKVIDYVISVYITTYFIECLDNETDIDFNDIAASLKKTLNTDSLRVLPQILETGYIGLQLANSSPFELSYQYTLDKNVDTKLPLGVDDENELILLSIEQLGNTLVIGDPKTRKTTFIKALVTTLILNKDESCVNVILDNSKENNLMIFKEYTYISTDIETSLNNLKLEFDKREALLGSSSFKNYNKNQLKLSKSPLSCLNIFLDEYKDEYKPMLVNLLSRSSKLGVNIIITSSFYIPEFSPYLSSFISYHIDNLEAAKIHHYKDVTLLLGKGDSLIQSKSLKRDHPLRIVTPYIEDKEIKRLLG